MNNKFTYFLDELSFELGAEKATICAKVWFFCGDADECTISMDYLCRLLRKDDERSVKRLIKELCDEGYIEYIPRYGRGVLPLYKKGAKLATFFDEKGYKNCIKKGTKIAPIKYNLKYKKNNNKLLLKKEDNDMVTFEQFWQAFFYGSYAKYEHVQSAYKEAAQAVWSLMPKEKQEACLAELRKGIHSIKTEYVVFYLQKYKQPLRIWYAQDPELTAAMVGKMCVLKHRGQVAYCYPEDLDRCLAAGAVQFANN